MFVCMLVSYVVFGLHVSVFSSVSVVLVGWIYRTLLCCPVWSSEGRRDPPGPGGGHRDQDRGIQILAPRFIMP